MKDTMDQLDDIAQKESRITITLVTHDDMSENTRVEVKLHESEPNTSLVSLVAIYVEKSK